MTYEHFVFIGLGGGWRTVMDLAFFASHFMPKAQFLLVDGGRYDSRQLDHEHFLYPGNKARVQAEFLKREYPELTVTYIDRYVGRTDSAQSVAVEETLPSGSIAFIQVDNNRARHVIAEYGQTLDDVTLLCGGTNQAQLRVMVHLRRHGHDLTAPFATYNDAIATPSDQAPFDERNPANCTDQLAERQELHPFTMLATSTFLANAFYEVWRREAAGILKSFPYDELWYDIRSGRSRTEQHSRQRR